MFLSRISRRLFASKAALVKVPSSRNIALKPFNGRIQYLSDIHLDRNPFESYVVNPAHWTKSRKSRLEGCQQEIQVKPEVLVVAGDLGNPFSRKFEAFFRDNWRWDRILFVPGNHEFYYDPYLHLELDSEQDKKRNGHYEGTVEKLRELEAKIPNLTVLMQDQTELEFSNGEKVSVLGCTLWSKIPPEHYQLFDRAFSDYRRITIGENREPMTSEQTNILHQEDVKWISDRMCDLLRKDQKALVITHHAPAIHETCHPRFIPMDKKGKVDRAKFYNYAFSSDLEYLFGNGIQAWIFGHTHYRCCFQHERGTVLAQNHLGYIKKPYQSIRVL